MRFGSYTEVNYGRGGRAIKTRKECNDLIVTFSVKGCGIDETETLKAQAEARKAGRQLPDFKEWAPKVLGKTKSGRMLWGYAHLPYVDYKPAVLSASGVEEKDGRQYVKVGNFGLSASAPTTMTVKNRQGQDVSVEVPALKPYEEQTFELK